MLKNRFGLVVAEVTGPWALLRATEIQATVTLQRIHTCTVRRMNGWLCLKYLLENRALKKTFLPKSDEMTGSTGDFVLGSIIFGIPQQILFGSRTQEYCDWLDMWHVWRRGDSHTGFG
jgi:hypothetical protein